MDAVQLLTEDHEQVRQLFEQYEQLVSSDADAQEKQELAEQICLMLTVHADLEEELFYPAARDALDEQDLLDEAQVEHASARDLIEQIQEMDPTEDLYDAKVKVLGEYVNHHVQEEENELFPKIQDAGIDLEALGEELATRKQELMEEMGAE
ncbi:hemerythrin domain-containing protein [Caldimonas tepidiphila]|uniref:hemerythrin domain-containing protein n=1 Tax=Caldimonas tepidiphila TaxID=2315841 RepID=UPI000E5AC9EE|nr:hemerythrin domain-containing protein [Caldimonas tepidiphila]